MYRILVWTGVIAAEPPTLLQIVVGSGVDMVEIVVGAMAGDRPYKHCVDGRENHAGCDVGY